MADLIDMSMCCHILDHKWTSHHRVLHTRGLLSNVLEIKLVELILTDIDIITLTCHIWHM